MRLVLFLTLSLPTFAQMMGKFYATGATFQTASHPELTAWAAIALPLDAKQENWSFSAYSVIPVKGPPITLQTSTTTGLTTQIKTIGPLHIFALGMGGFVTNGKYSGGSGSVGPLGVLPLGRRKTWNILGAYLKTTTNLPVKDTDSYWLGFGRSF